MQKLKITTYAFLLIAFYSMTLFFSCGTNNASTAASYHNQLMTLMQPGDAHMDEMNKAMKARDYNQAEAIRETWDRDLDHAIQQAKKTDAYKGDASLESAITSGLGIYKNTLDHPYKELIELRLNANSASLAAGPTKEEALLDSINAAFEGAAGSINQASKNFQAKYSEQ